MFDYSFQCFHHMLEIKDLHLILESSGFLLYFWAVGFDFPETESFFFLLRLD